MPIAICDDDSIECSLTRIADSLTGDWTFLDWVVNLGLPIAGVAASILIGVASIRLTVAANRVSARATAAEEQKEGREARERLVALMLEWLEVHWAEFSGVDAVPVSAETKLQASLRLTAAAINRAGINTEDAMKIIDAGKRALASLEAMPPLERRVSSTGLKSMVSTAAHSYLALPDEVDETINAFDQRLDLLESRAERRAARDELREVLRTSARPDGSERSPEEIESLLDAFEAQVPGSTS